VGAVRTLRLVPDLAALHTPKAEQLRGLPFSAIGTLKLGIGQHDLAGAVAYRCVHIYIFAHTIS
jgi:hypothetical protein